MFKILGHITWCPLCHSSLHIVSRQSKSLQSSLQRYSQFLLRGGEEFGVKLVSRDQQDLKGQKQCWGFQMGG